MSVKVLSGVSNSDFELMCKLTEEKNRLENDVEFECCPEVRMFLYAKIENINKRISRLEVR